MNKAWKVVSMIALLSLLVGILCVGVGFFTGSSPVVIQSHGSLAEYAERLRVNWDILKQMLGI